MALVISDHIMPGRSGVELLAELAADRRFAGTKKVLLTGQATHRDTIEAVNAARIDHYFEKPWDPDELLNTGRRLVTEFCPWRSVWIMSPMPACWIRPPCTDSCIKLCKSALFALLFLAGLG